MNELRASASGRIANVGPPVAYARSHEASWPPPATAPAACPDRITVPATSTSNASAATVASRVVTWIPTVRDGSARSNRANHAPADRAPSGEVLSVERIQ